MTVSEFERGLRSDTGAVEALIGGAADWSWPPIKSLTLAELVAPWTICPLCEAELIDFDQAIASAASAESLDQWRDAMKRQADSAGHYCPEDSNP